MKPRHKAASPHLKRPKMSVEGKTAFPRNAQAFANPSSMQAPDAAFGAAMAGGASPSEAQG